MAIEVRIPKEITEYKEKVLFGLSVRQLICLSLAVVVGVGSYLLLTKVLGISMDIASYVIILEAIPLMAIGFIKKNGLTFEKYFVLFLRHKTGQQIRKYQTELLTEKIETTDKDKKGGKYAWIFEKDQTGKEKPIIDKKTQTADRKLGEYDLFKSAEESSKRKRKTTLRKIKTARKEFRSLERRAKKDAKAASRATDSTANNPV